VPIIEDEESTDVLKITVHTSVLACNEIPHNDIQSNPSIVNFRDRSKKLTIENVDYREQSFKNSYFHVGT
jgi:hypothetical protein